MAEIIKIFVGGFLFIKDIGGLNILDSINQGLRNILPICKDFRGRNRLK